MSGYDLEYMHEDEAMKLPGCINHNIAANLTTSKIAIQGNKNRIYYIGEYIIVSIKLYNGYGEPLKKGDAVLRAQMFNSAKDAYSTASIKDLHDGNYIAKFETLWVGNSTIKVHIAYTPETIRATYYIRQKGCTCGHCLYHKPIDAQTSNR